MRARAKRQTRVHFHDHRVGVGHLLVVRTYPQPLAEAHGMKILQPFTLPSAVLDDSGVDERRGDAERFAQLAGGTVYPVHLLYAVLLSDDQNRDDTFKQLGIAKTGLQEAAKREVVRHRASLPFGTSKNKARWN